MIETQLLSKVLEEQDFYILNKHNINEEDFVLLKPVYSFIKDYVKEYNQTPDIRTVSIRFDEFDYMAEVIDTFRFLCMELKAQTAKRKMFELLQHEATEKFQQLDGLRFTKWLKEKIDLLEKASGSFMTGVDYSKNGEERKETYLDKKKNKKEIFVPTPFQKLTEGLNGGFLLSDYVLLLAFTNAGKTWLASQIGVTAYNAGFNILHYSIELPRDQQLSRLDTVNGHFKNSKLTRGELTNENEFFEYLENFNSRNKTSYIVKSMGDLPDGLTVDQIETDINIYQPHVVIIDGFNLMRHKNGTKNMRNNLSQTSRELRQLFGKYSVMGLVVHQSSAESEKSKKKTDVEDVLISVPNLLSYSETIATIQDCSTCLCFGQKDGSGKLVLEKSRTPNVGLEIELHCDFNSGYIKEVLASDFF
jgi:replicative DNA helicase